MLLPLLMAMLAVPARESRAQQERAGVPTVVVIPFDFAAPVAERAARVAPPGPMRGWPLSRMGRGSPVVSRVERGDGPADGVGEGIAALLVERLLANGAVRVLEREHLDAVLAERARADRGAQGARPSEAEGADYVVTGAVVEFGVEESRASGGLGRLAGLGGLGVRRPTTTVTLVTRVVSARTGEVMLALRSQGISRKGKGVTLGAVVHGAGGIFSVGSSAFRESALGEATERAVDDLATRIVERRGSLPGH